MLSPREIGSEFLAVAVAITDINLRKRNFLSDVFERIFFEDLRSFSAPEKEKSPGGGAVLV